MELFTHFILGLYVVGMVINLLVLTFNEGLVRFELTKGVFLFGFLLCAGIAAWAAFLIWGK